MTRLSTLAAIILIFLCGASICFAQEQPIQVDQFGKVNNDDLLAHVDQLQIQVQKGNSVGFVILHGSTIEKYFNKRRIEGCNLMREYPVDSFKFVFAKDHGDTLVEFWRVPRGFGSPKFTSTVLDYKLDDLTKPVELSVSTGTTNFARGTLILIGTLIFYMRIRDSPGGSLSM